MRGTVQHEPMDLDAGFLRAIEWDDFCDLARETRAARTVAAGARARVSGPRPVFDVESLGHPLEFTGAALDYIRTRHWGARWGVSRFDITAEGEVHGFMVTGAEVRARSYAVWHVASAFGGVAWCALRGLAAEAQLPRLLKRCGVEEPGLLAAVAARR